MKQSAFRISAYSVLYFYGFDAHPLRRLLFSIPLCVILLATPGLFSPQGTQAQQFPAYVERGIDSALSSILMTRSDLTMRWDAVEDDPHRLGEIKRLFGAPLDAFAVTDAFAGLAAKANDEPALLIRYIGQLLELGDNLMDTSSPPVNDREIRLFGKFDIDALDYSSAIILRQYLALAIALDVKMLNYRGKLAAPQLQRLIDYSDSLLLQSEDDAETDLITMRMEERYGLQRAKKFFNQDAIGLDYRQIINTGVVLYLLSRDYAKTMAPELPSYYGKVKTSVWTTPLGLIAIGGAGDDVYVGDFFCIIDIGGNDIYRAAPKTKQDAIDKSVSLIVDFAGNDTYIGEDYAFGGTLFGASAVIDMKGDDSYSVRNFGLGSGYFGTGIVHDMAGNDRYSGSTCVQGAGMFGLGLLIDDDGNDNYLAHLESQGFGFTRGLGAIVEGGGNDSYISSSPYQDYLRYDDHYESFCQGAALGSRPLASGGYGFIADAAGNDTYVADIFAQGTAYWFGLGGIADSKGSDSYNAYQYSQGSGVHLAHGVLMDKAGDDNYVSHGVSQGCGHDIAFGGLYDALGQDNYVVESLSLGGGNANAISLFIDAAGRDGYIAREDNTLGYSDLRRWYGMIGLFLDLDGDDFYGTSRGGNDTLWTGSAYGAGLDATFRPAEEIAKEAAKEKKPAEQIAKELSDDVPTLFIQASAAPQKYQYLVEPARKKLEAMGEKALPYLLAQLDSEQPREALALRVMLPRIGVSLTPRLIDTVIQGAAGRVPLAIHILGLIKDSTAAKVIGQKLIAGGTPNWRLRSTAAEALMEMNATDAKEYLATALYDSIDLVRARSARALARVATPEELQSLLPLLNDSSQIVRYQVQLGLQRRGVDSITTFLVDALLRQRVGYTYSILYPLARELGNEDIREGLLEEMLGDRSAAIRADAVRLALHWNDNKLLRRALRIKDKEKNSEVLFELYRAIEALNDNSTKSPRTGKRRRR